MLNLRTLLPISLICVTLWVRVQADPLVTTDADREAKADLEEFELFLV